MNLLPPGTEGATWFLRCADCHALYEPFMGWSMATGAQEVAWQRPKRRRRPRICDHYGPVERWNGTAWVVVHTHTSITYGAQGGEHAPA